MTGEALAARGRRQRPPGFAPRGTSLGVVGWLGLTAGVPMAAVLTAQPLLPDGVTVLIAAIPWIVGSTFLLMIALVAGFRARRFWTICLFFYVGMTLLAAYAAILAFALAVVVRLVPFQDPGAYPASVWGLIFALLQMPFAWWLRRALRLRYWEPGSRPDQWELGDETPPAWAMSPTRTNKRKSH